LTAPPIPPDATAFDANKSTCDDKLTKPPAVLVWPKFTSNIIIAGMLAINVTLPVDTTMELPLRVTGIEMREVPLYN
jgi:hypothetical protein